LLSDPLPDGLRFGSASAATFLSFRSNRQEWNVWWGPLNRDRTVAASENVEEIEKYDD
jgi:hypothetical protein